MRDRCDLGCGCTFVQLADLTWWQVVACPVHVMIIQAMAEPSVKKRRRGEEVSDGLVQ